MDIVLFHHCLLESEKSYVVRMNIFRDFGLHFLSISFLESWSILFLFICLLITKNNFLTYIVVIYPSSLASFYVFLDFLTVLISYNVCFLYSQSFFKIFPKDNVNKDFVLVK